MKLREKAIESVRQISDNQLKQVLIDSHLCMNHKWVCVYPDGSISETEEADNNTTHWVSYPEKEVVNIYTISTATCEPCNCDICVEFRHFERLDKQEFIEAYGEDEWNYCNETELENAILEYCRDNGISQYDIVDEMIDNIEGIEYGYFDDEI